MRFSPDLRRLFQMGTGLVVFWTMLAAPSRAKAADANPKTTSSDSQVSPETLPEGNSLAYLPSAAAAWQSDKTTADAPDQAGETSSQSDEKSSAFKEENFNVYGQGTIISQWNGPFHSDYSGPHSFLSEHDFATSATGTVFLGARVWDNTEAYFDPEVAGGLGLSDVFGIAAFPNGDITRVGNVEPTPYIARLYLQQTINIGGDDQEVKSGPNQLAERKNADRLTLVAGKFAAEDWFDQNSVSHDPRSQFQNWALMYNAAWDYPADVRGYTYGGVVELREDVWSLRYGIFAEPTEANGPSLDLDFGRFRGQAWEYEQRYKLWDDHPGVARFLAYWNRADMGNYREATDDPAFGLNIANTRSNSIKYGFGLNMEQEFTTDLNGFLRWGWNDGHTETWAFTECDRTITLGATLKGTGWCRNDDLLGCGVAIDGLSSAHAAYLAAGGLGFELGDGQLAYNPEIAFETFYSFKFKDKQLWITPDVQLIGDPGYNRDRGPVVIGAVRVHAEL